MNQEETRNAEEQLKREELKAKKREKEEQRRQECSEAIESQFEKVSCELSELESDVGDESDPEYQPCVDKKKTREGKRMLRKRKAEWETKVAETADRFKISCDAAAHLANSLSCAEENKDKVLISRRVDRMRKRARLEKKDKFKGFKAEGLMVDERINDNKVEKGIGEKGHKRFSMVRQEDCAVIGYPGERYLGHLVPEGGRAVELASSLMRFVEERGIDLEKLVVMFADGCSKMSGHKHGFITEFERLLGRPVLHVHCLIHSHEKIFGHMFVHYAGPTTGPSSWSGEEAQKLTGEVWELKVVDFEAIPNPTLRAQLNKIPEEVLKQLNHDTRCVRKSFINRISTKLMQTGICLRWQRGSSQVLWKRGGQSRKQE